MKFTPWTGSQLSPFVEFWNRHFAVRRNFFPLTGDLFRRRVTSSADFDPARLILAREGKDIAGFVHVGIRPESVCRSMDPEWRTGSQGFVAFLFVDPSRRRKGLGTELWHRGLAALKGTRQVVLDGQCLNPWYGNSPGPSTPFWGTPEGVCVEWNDSATKKFLARKGFAPRIKGAQMVLDLGTVAGTFNEGQRALSRLGVTVQVLQDEYPQLGKPPKARRALPEGLTYEVVAALRRGRVAGLVAYYPMKEVRPGLYGIYEAAVLPQLRGKALGKRLMQAALRRLKERGGASVEALTLPELSTAAHKLYSSEGFQWVQSWAVY
jgi:ribosomal protein S18 acetylase RimI-like enzyme